MKKYTSMTVFRHGNENKAKFTKNKMGHKRIQDDNKLELVVSFS